MTMLQRRAAMLKQATEGAIAGELLAWHVSKFAARDLAIREVRRLGRWPSTQVRCGRWRRADAGVQHPRPI